VFELWCIVDGTRVFSVGVLSDAQTVSLDMPLSNRHKLEHCNLARAARRINHRRPV